MARCVVRIRFRPAGLLFAVCLLAASPLAAEVFELRDGGRVVGRLLNPNEAPRKTYQIETLSGGQITLAADQVVKRAAQSPKEIEYEKLRADSPDTIDGHWKLSEWCRENYLSAQRKLHLNRILELDPDHKAARTALGYTRVDGQWKTRQQIMESRGLRLYQGRWRTPQEIEVLERKQQQTQSAKKWFGLMRRYSGWLDGDKYEQGRQAILAIDDPLAVDAIAQYLAKDHRRGAQTLYIEALAGINTPDAMQALAVCAMDDDDQEVRLLCLDHLKKEKRPPVVAYFVRMLKNKDNAIINRAGVALGAMGDKSAVGPLIDALVTRHKIKITSGNPGGISPSFNSSGGAGLGVGSSTRTIWFTKKNQSVLDALESLSGVNFGFDVQAWKYWFEQQTKHAPASGRRD